ncbi:hypothetical protein [uncultured Flavobacterium sp.]|uniref:hypothetical protein n=1 Tax=uncultured Flavobacterium sp. TaxID=165435 RepID=UPI002595D1DB|nr:hypothetical protein [uncultured Flavobacterium sp.]
MRTFTPKEQQKYLEFFDLHAKDVSNYILSSGHSITEESITLLGNAEAKRSFMDFPDYDENQPCGIEDSLVVLYFDYVEDDIEFDMLYDFFCQNLKYCLCKLTGAED